MPRTTGFLRALAAGAACPCALAAGPALANDDTQYWQYLFLNLPAGQDSRLTLEVSPRAREGATGDEQLLNRVSYDHRVNAHLSIGAGGAFAAAVGPNELRAHQQVALMAGVLEARTRVEERFFHNTDRMALRLRQRLQVTVPVAQATRASLSGELLYNARTQTIGTPTGVDSWRLRAAVQHRITDHFEVTGAYLLMLSPRGVREDQWSHVPQIGLTWRM